MRVLLLRTWLTNIGNGFIDKGAKALINNVLQQDDEIIEASGYPNYFFDHRKSGPVRGIADVVGEVGEQLEGVQRARNERASGNVVNVGQLVDVDLAIIPGCILYEYALRKFKPVLEELRANNTPIVFLGAGGADYTDETQGYVKQFITEYNVGGLITRDQKAYELYSDSVTRSYRGIDCGFFIDDWYTPPEASKSFITATFDKKEEPKLSAESKIIRPTHTPFNDLSSVIGLVKELHPDFSHRGPQKALETENLFLSDSIEDYLFIYANASETHADRIHACVPALAYGNAAKFYYETPRAGLFDEILKDDITKSPTMIDSERMKEKKQEQASQLKQIVMNLK